MKRRDEFKIKELFSSYNQKELRCLYSLYSYGILGTPTGFKDINDEEIQVGDIVCGENEGYQEGIVVAERKRNKVIYRIFVRFQLKNLNNLKIIQKWNNLTQKQCKASALMFEDEDYDFRYWRY